MSVRQVVVLGNVQILDSLPKEVPTLSERSLPSARRFGFVDLCPTQSIAAMKDTLQEMSAARRDDDARTTMKHIAKRLGVHVTTVSLALRNSPRICVETRERVWRMADSMKYRRDPELDIFNARRFNSATRLADSRVALVLGPALGGAESNHIRSNMFESLRESAASFGTTLERYEVGVNGLTLRRIEGILISRGISSVLLAGFGTESAGARIGFDCLTGLRLESFLLHSPFDIISPNHRQSARIAVQNLRKAGHRRIGLVLSEKEDLNLQGLWRAGYLVEMRPTPETSWTTPFVFKDPQSVNEREAFAAWVRYHALEAVISNLSEIPEMLALQSVSIPENLSFACLDLPPGNTHLSGVSIDWMRVCHIALQTLAVRHKNHSRYAICGVSTTFVPMHFQSGKTIKTLERAMPI